jgi:hypothetical protein
MHLRTFVDMRRRLRSLTFVFHLLLLDDTCQMAVFDITRAQMHLRSATKLRKWMRCVLFCCPGQTRFGTQGLPRTIATT